MMTDESPNSQSIFDFNKDGRSTPPPTTSKAPVILTGTETNDSKEATTSSDHLLKEHSPDTNRLGMLDGSSDKENEVSISDEKPLYDKEKNDERDSNDNEHSKSNGKNLDAKWVPPPNYPKEEEEDSCIVNCLYYGMQCCECTII